MKKIILIFIFITSSIYANQTTSLCKKNLKNMTNFYYNGVKLKEKNNDKDSIKNFQQSIASANSSLDSCVDNTKFDFRVVYDYITSAEFEIQMIDNQ